MQRPKPWDKLPQIQDGNRIAISRHRGYVVCHLWYWFLLSDIIRQLPIRTDSKACFSPASYWAPHSPLALHLPPPRKAQGWDSVPEMRPWLIFSATLLSAIALIIFGVSVNSYHRMAETSGNLPVRSWDPDGEHVYLLVLFDYGRNPPLSKSQQVWQQI